MSEYPTFDEVHRMFCIDDDTGVVYRRRTTSPRARKGDIVGSLNNNGYLCTRIGNTLCSLHIIVWIYYYGYKPENILDHKDRVKLNIRIDNLREVTSQCNSRNCPLREDNTSGVAGVYFHEGRDKWRAQIMLNGSKHHLGSYKSYDEAVLVRFAAEQCLGWDHCNNQTSAFLYVKERLWTT